MVSLLKQLRWEENADHNFLSNTYSADTRHVLNGGYASDGDKNQFIEACGALGRGQRGHEEDQPRVTHTQIRGGEGMPLQQPC